MSKRTPRKSKSVKSLPSNECLCGCGEKCRNHFKQGHDARVAGWLISVAEGERPEGVHGRTLSRIMQLVADKHPAFSTPHMRVLAKAALSPKAAKKVAA